MLAVNLFARKCCRHFFYYSFVCFDNAGARLKLYQTGRLLLNMKDNSGRDHSNCRVERTTTVYWENLLRVISWIVSLFATVPRLKVRILSLLDKPRTQHTNSLTDNRTRRIHYGSKFTNTSTYLWSVHPSSYPHDLFLQHVIYFILSPFSLSVSYLLKICKQF